MVTTLTAMFFINASSNATTVEACTNQYPFVTKLIAGQHINVGEVTVWNTAQYLYVKYQTNDDWFLEELHLHVATRLADIPHTNKGNPIPGKFQYKIYLSEPTNEYTFKIPLKWNENCILYIAAHAVVYCVDDMTRKETAWGYGCRFVRSTWATYFTYRVRKCTDTIWPESGIATIAYEDFCMPSQENDYDYNDFITDVSVIGTYSTGLTKLNFTFNARARGGWYNHTLHLRIPANTFGSDGTWFIEYYENNGSMIGSATLTFGKDKDIDLIVFENTYFASPPNWPPDYDSNTRTGHGLKLCRKTVIVLNFTKPFEFDMNDYNPEKVGIHGENLFFDPYLFVKNTLQEVHIGDPRIIVIPTNWAWPASGIGIWEVYPYNSVTSEGVTAGNPPTFTKFWYKETPTDKKWTP